VTHKCVCSSASSYMSRPTERLATRRRSFSLSAMLAQKLDDLLIALFLRLIERCFPRRVLRVQVRLLIQQQFYHLLFAANDSLVQKGNVFVVLCVGIR